MVEFTAGGVKANSTLSHLTWHSLFMMTPAFRVFPFFSQEAFFLILQVDADFLPGWDSGMGGYKKGWGNGRNGDFVCVSALGVSLNC